MTNLGSLFDALDDEEQMREGYIRAPMSMAGCKFQCLDQLTPHLPLNRNGSFIDVFGGTGQVLLARRPTRLDVYNDRHSGLVAFYRCMQDESKTEEIIERLKFMPHSREIFKWCKDTWPKSDSDVDRAIKYYYVLTISFSGACRNFGRSTSSANNTLSKLIQNRLPLFWDVHQRFKSIQIENLDWRQVFRDYDHPDTVFYCDPPYVGSDIYEFKMSEKEHGELCERIFNLQGFVALSGFENPIYENYPWTNIHSWDLRTFAQSQAYTGTTKNCSDFARDIRTEYLWIKDFE